MKLKTYLAHFAGTWLTGLPIELCLHPKATLLQVLQGHFHTFFYHTRLF